MHLSSEPKGSLGASSRAEALETSTFVRPWSSTSLSCKFWRDTEQKFVSRPFDRFISQSECHYAVGFSSPIQPSTSISREVINSSLTSGPGD